MSTLSSPRTAELRPSTDTMTSNPFVDGTNPTDPFQDDTSALLPRHVPDNYSISSRTPLTGMNSAHYAPSIAPSESISIRPDESYYNFTNNGAEPSSSRAGGQIGLNGEALGPAADRRPTRWSTLGFATEVEYINALRAWAEEKKYVTIGNGQLEGFYGKKTMGDIIDTNQRDYGAHKASKRRDSNSKSGMRRRVSEGLNNGSGMGVISESGTEEGSERVNGQSRTSGLLKAARRKSWFGGGGGGDADDSASGGAKSKISGAMPSRRKKSDAMRIPEDNTVDSRDEDEADDSSYRAQANGANGQTSKIPARNANGISFPGDQAQTSTPNGQGRLDSNLQNDEVDGAEDEEAQEDPDGVLPPSAVTEQGPPRYSTITRIPSSSAAVSSLRAHNTPSTSTPAAATREPTATGNDDDGAIREMRPQGRRRSSIGNFLRRVRTGEKIGG